MVFIYLISIFFACFYGGIMLYYWYNWKTHPQFSKHPLTNYPSVSILIPVRNEAANIEKLLKDLLHQDYPAEQLEIVVINDHSTDETEGIVQRYLSEQVKIINLKDVLSPEDKTKAYKKKAIEMGVQISSGEYILTTDGDCRIPNSWVKSMVSIAQQSSAKLVTGPVVFSGERTLFEQFQTLDFLGMMGITAASLKGGFYNMANGANMLYEKAAFYKVGGFKGIDHTASGDDMLLVFKMAKEYKGAVIFAKSRDAVVFTEPMRSLSDFLQQRFRWTSKSGQYQDKRMTVILGFVFLSVLCIPVFLIGGIWSSMLLRCGIFMLIVKSLVDIPLLYSTAKYFRKPYLMKTYLSSQLMHIIYIVGVGSLGNILSYEWKGRKLKDK